MLSAFSDNVIVDSIRVYPPRRPVLLCGGIVSDINSPAPVSLRDAFLRGNWTAAVKGAELTQIEEIEEYFEKDAPYKDFLEFEDHIAQISELVILFSESPGSFAELGAFSTRKAICENMLVVIRSKFLARTSFITKGPIASLKRDFPNSVFAITDAHLDISGNDYSKIKCDVLTADLTNPIQVRLQESEARTTLDTSKFNHLCKIYVALLREFYGLKDHELLSLLEKIGFSITPAALDQVAFCCSALRWSATTTTGFDRVHLALAGNEAAKFEFRDRKLADKIRRRTEFLQHWKDGDAARVSAVDERLGR